MIKALDVGLNNIVFANRLIAISNPDSLSIRKVIKSARKSGLLIDVTQGRKTKSALFTDSGHVILSLIKPETLQIRIDKEASHEIHSRSANID